MIQHVIVPSLGGLEHLEIIEVLVTPGITIKKGDPVLVVETEKASLEIVSEYSGVIDEILVKKGDKISQGDCVATIAQQDQKEQTVTDRHIVAVPSLGGEDSLEIIDVIAEIGKSIAKNSPVLLVETQKASLEIVSDCDGTIQEIFVKKGDKVKQGTAILALKKTLLENPILIPEEKQNIINKELNPPQTTVAHQPKIATGEVYAGPAVRKLARELGVSLTNVSGTGPRGRITLDDLKAFVRHGLKQSPAPSAASKRDLPDFNQWGQVTEQPMSSVRKMSAAAMVYSWQNIPHVTHFEQANISSLEIVKERLKAEALEQGAKLTPLVFVVKAIVQALKKFPEFNSSFRSDESSLLIKDYINIGIAVETPEGLVVPVIHNPDQYNLIELAIEIQELASLARARRLPLSRMQGQTFTISSLGSIGGLAFTPIINWPDVAILGVSKIQDQLRLLDGQVQLAKMMPLSLSYDHRVIDGAAAARFSAYLVNLIENISTWLL